MPTPIKRQPKATRVKSVRTVSVTYEVIEEFNDADRKIEMLAELLDMTYEEVERFLATLE